MACLPSTALTPSLLHISWRTTRNQVDICGPCLVEWGARCQPICFWNPITGCSFERFRNNFVNISLFRVLKKKFLNRQANRRLEVLISILIDDVAPYYNHVQLTSVCSSRTSQETVSFQMVMGSFTKRQKEASLKHDAATAIASQIAQGIRLLDIVDAQTWRMWDADGIGSYVVKRQGCLRICAVCRTSI